MREMFEATNEILRGDGTLDTREQLRILFGLWPRAWQYEHMQRFNTEGMTFAEIGSAMDLERNKSMEKIA